MFDKNETSKRLLSAGISTPEVFDFDWSLKPEALQNLHKALEFCDCPTAYFKLANGSSGSGIIKVDCRSESVVGLSTMVNLHGSYFNTRNLKTLTGQPLAEAIEFLHQQGVTIQRGIKKATIDATEFDVRAVVINRQVEFTVFRKSDYPITNLHLGGYRGDWKRCRSAVPNRIWLDAMDDCVAAAELYDTDVVGIDLMFDQGFMNHYIIELNPMGDFFPDWKNEYSKSIHQVEIESNLKRWDHYGP